MLTQNTKSRYDVFSRVLILLLCWLIVSGCEPATEGVSSYVCYDCVEGLVHREDAFSYRLLRVRTNEDIPCRLTKVDENDAWHVTIPALEADSSPARIVLDYLLYSGFDTPAFVISPPSTSVMVKPTQGISRVQYWPEVPSRAYCLPASNKVDAQTIYSDYCAMVPVEVTILRLDTQPTKIVISWDTRVLLEGKKAFGMISVEEPLLLKTAGSDK